MRCFKALLIAIFVVSSLPTTRALSAEPKSSSIARKPQTKCPIQGEAIDKKLFTDYKGKRIYFCCSGCVDTFKKDPEKYMSAMDKEGIELEKSPAGSPNK